MGLGRGRKETRFPRLQAECQHQHPSQGLFSVNKQLFLMPRVLYPPALPAHCLLRADSCEVYSLSLHLLLLWDSLSQCSGFSYHYFFSGPIQEKLGLSLDHKSRIFQNLNGALGEETAMRKGAMREAVGGPECGWGSW